MAKRAAPSGTYHAASLRQAVRGPSHAQAHPSHYQGQPAKRSPPSPKPRGKVVD